MADSQLMQFTSHVAGKCAEVRIFTSRVQWILDGRRQVVRMLPLWAISAVDTKRSLPGKSTLTVASSAGMIAFRVDKSIAEQAATTLTRLVTQQEPPSLDESPTIGRGSIADELASLGWLRDMGVLTAAEFDEQSEKLLSVCEPMSRDQSGGGGHRPGLASFMR